MRRITLILSDLYLPEEAGRGDAVPVMQKMPDLEWLLRFSDWPELIDDWRRWLLADVAPDFDGGGLDSTWLATPVAMEARLDHVRLLDRGLLRLDESERASCREEFARVFGPQFLLEDGGTRAFVLSGLPAAGVHTVDPARLLGSEIGPALPRREASELRRLWTEIEMWLHGAAFNAARERAGKRRVSALWMWAAKLPHARAGRFVLNPDAALYGRDPMIEAIMREAGDAPRDVPGHWTQLDTSAPHVVMEFAALTGGPHESLAALDASWFAPAKSALVAGDIRELDLVVNDRHFRIGARPQWKFWRRRRPWLASLTS